MFSPPPQKTVIMWCEGYVNLIMIIVLQYICISNHHTVYLKLIQGYMSITRGNLLKEKKKKAMEEQIKNKVRISLVARWLRFHLSMKETHGFDAWSGKDPCCKATRPVCHSHWALKPVRHSKGEKPTHCNQDPVQPKRKKYFTTSRPTLKSGKTKMYKQK